MGSRGGDHRGLIAVAGAVLVVWLGVSLPLALGRDTLSFRDVFNLHLPWKAFGAAELAAGRIPALDPARGLGQPFRGDPQTLAFYPDNLLYLALPFWSAFNLHFALHWLLALVTFYLLARELGQGPEAALLAAIAWAGSGFVLSCLSFYHTLTVAAWWPLVLWGGARGGRLGVAVGGVACGLALLGGEPVLATLGLVPLLLVTLHRHGLRKGLATASALGLLGLAVALPQVVATARVLPGTFRASTAVPAARVALYGFAPARLLELLLPLPFGWPGELGRYGYWAAGVVDRVPLILSLYPGVVATALAAAAVRRRPGWTALAGIGLLSAWLGGAWGDALAAATGGLFRYPEKLLLWPALALPLLAGWGLEQLLPAPRRWARATLAAAAAAALAAALLFLRAGPAVAWVRRHARPQSPPGTGTTQVALTLVALAAAAALLALAAWAAHRRRPSLLVGLELLALLQLFPLVLTEPTAPYRSAPPWAQLAGPGAAVVNDTVGSVFWRPTPPYRISLAERPAGFSTSDLDRIAALDLDAVPGVLFGLSYPLALDPDGFYAPETSFLLHRLPSMGWGDRLPWLRRVGATALTTVERPTVDGMTVVGVAVRRGVPTYLVRIDDPAPAAWWPRSLATASGPGEALARSGGGADPTDRAAVPRGGVQDPGGSVRLIAAGPDRLELEVASATGGVAVVRRAYQDLWRARLADDPGVRLETMPADLCLLGVRVPPGRHRVLLAVSAWPEALAAALSLLAALGAVLLARGVRR